MGQGSKGSHDIKRLLDQKVYMYNNLKFGFLIQEAKNMIVFFRSPTDQKCSYSAFIRLQGKLRAAVCWLQLSNKSKGSPLQNPLDSIQMKINGKKDSINVIDAPKLEHSQSHPPIPLIH